MECFCRVVQERKSVVRLVLATKESVLLLENTQDSANLKVSLKATCFAAVLSREAFLLHLILEIVSASKQGANITNCSAKASLKLPSPISI